MRKTTAVFLSFLFILSLFSTNHAFAASTATSDNIYETQDLSEQKIVKEDITKRNTYEKHFVCEDGTYIAVTYPEQVCYKDSNGNWLEVDNTLSEKEGRISNNNSETKVSFATKADNSQLVKLDYDNYEFSWDLDFYKKSQRAVEESNIEEVKVSNSAALYTAETAELSTERLTGNDKQLSAEKVESKIRYENVYSDKVDVEYTVLPNRVKENIIINEKTDLSGYSMNIACEDLTATLDGENGIEFKDKNGRVKYYIQTPYMFDDVYEVSYDIGINIVETDFGYTVTFYPDLNWLNDEERVYPIIIDPTVRTNTTKANFSDTYVYQASTASKSRAFEERLRVGIYDSKVHRVLWKAETLPTIPQYAAINSATFKLKLPDVTNTSRAFSLYQINSIWDSYTITWSQAEVLSKTLLNSNVARNSSDDTLTFSGANLTNVVKNWYVGVSNSGFMIRYTNESLSNPDYNVFYSSDNTTSTSYMPYLLISYSYGAAKAYRNVTSTVPRCLSYAFYYDSAVFVDIYDNDTVTTTFNRLKSQMQSSPYNRTVRKLASSDRINTNEYLIVMRIGSHRVQGQLVTDYHFMVQTNSGGWAHKPGQRPSQNLGNINPSSYNWSFGTTGDSYYYAYFYDSTPIYFATNGI